MPKSEDESVFVIMPFKQPFNDYYKQIIKPAIEEMGYRSIRVDEIYSPSAFLQSIWRCVLDSKCLIAEMTGMNANVLYELGLAHAINKSVIMITQSIEDVPSDLRHINCITYDVSNVHWGESLKTQIKRMIQNVTDSERDIPYLSPSASIDNTLLVDNMRKDMISLQQEHKATQALLTSEQHDHGLSVERLHDVEKQISGLSIGLSNHENIATVTGEKDNEKLFVLPLHDTGLTIELIEIPAGEFLYGFGRDTQKIILDSFYIGKYSVTNAQYCSFLNRVGLRTEEGEKWLNLEGESPADKCRIVKVDSGYTVETGFEDHPVTYVNYFGAQAFCEWLGGVCQQTYNGKKQPEE